MKVLVTGATGNVGAVVLRELRDAGAEVRAGVHGDRQLPGVEAVAFDFLDATTWTSACTDVEAMFVVRPPALGRPKTQILPALAAARAAGVRHLVFLSLQGAERNPVVPHAAIEKWVRTSGVEWTFVRASFFHQNLSTAHLTDVRDRDTIMVPAGTGATAFVDAEDVGAVAAAALLDRARHANRAWTVTGSEALSYYEVAEIFTRELGRPITYANPGLLRYASHARRALDMPWGMVAVTSAIYTTARLGMAASLTDDVHTVLGREPIRFASFVHRERARWNPAGAQSPG